MLILLWMTCLGTLSHIKTVLTQAPILQALNWSLLFELMCDTSDYAISSIFGERVEKKLVAIYYASNVEVMREIYFDDEKAIKSQLLIIKGRNYT